MANKLKRLKNGMGGSRCGKERTQPTADMKKYGKKLRRQEDKNAVDEEMLALERIAIEDYLKFEEME